MAAPMMGIIIKSVILFYVLLQQNHSKTDLNYERKEHYF